MTDPLAPKPNDDALLESLLSDEGMVRSHVGSLRGLAAGARFEREDILLSSAADVIRVLWNAVREHVSCQR